MVALIAEILRHHFLQAPDQQAGGEEHQQRECDLSCD